MRKKNECVRIPRFQALDLAAGGSLQASANSSLQSPKMTHINISDTAIGVYMHSLVHVRHSLSCGGGRGVFAGGFIRAGTVVLTEMPRVTLPDDACGDAQVPMHVSYALGILSGTCGPPDELLEQLRCLHPTDSSHVPECHRAALLAEYSPHFEALSAAAATHGCLLASQDELFLLLCRLRFNCFSSGLYITSSLVNHSCNPNCSKFSRTDTAFAVPVTEFIATRDIPAGEEITISYFGSVELSHSGRTLRFLAQHCARLPATPFPPPLDCLPEGCKECDVEALELQLDALAPTVVSAAADDALSLVARLRSLHACAVSLCGQGHIVGYRVVRLLVAASSAVLGSRSGGDAAAGISAALDIVQDGLQLLPAMESYLGSEHCDVATLLLDISNALEHLFASGDKRVYALAGMQTYSAASRKAYAMKQRSERIQLLYAAANA
jgi:hypothetical protein